MLVMLLLCALGAIAITLLLRFLRHRRQGKGRSKHDPKAEMEARLQEILAEADADTYPCIKVLEIEGMVGERSRFLVRNALSRVRGSRAAVSLSRRQAVVYLKQPVEDDVLCQAVADQGFHVIAITSNAPQPQTEE